MSEVTEKARTWAQQTIDHHDQQCMAFGGEACTCQDCEPARCEPARHLLAALDYIEALEKYWERGCMLSFNNAGEAKRRFEEAINGPD
jgi:hypothetical protein